MFQISSAIQAEQYVLVGAREAEKIVNGMGNEKNMNDDEPVKCCNILIIILLKFFASRSEKLFKIGEKQFLLNVKRKTHTRVAWHEKAMNIYVVWQLIGLMFRINCLKWYWRSVWCSNFYDNFPLNGGTIEIKQSEKFHVKNRQESVSGLVYNWYVRT